MGVHEGKKDVQEQLITFCLSILSDKQRKDAIDEIEKGFTRMVN
jgi:hypothetical protein